MTGSICATRMAVHVQAGLKITLHGGEVDNEIEVDAMLDFLPDRFGHMCVLTELQEQRLLVRFRFAPSADCGQ